MQDRFTPSILKRVRVATNLWQRTKDGRFEDIRVNPATGKQQLRTLRATTLTEAKREQRALAVTVDRGEAVGPSRMKFEQVADEFILNFESLVASGERSARTLERYRDHLNHHLLPYFGRRAIQKISPDIVARFFIEKREAGLSAWTRKGMQTVLGRIFALAARRGYISENPLKRLDSSELPKPKNKQEARTLSHDELAGLIEHTPTNYRPIISTLALTGMRLQEALGLVWGDVDFEAGAIRVRYQLTRATRLKPAERVTLKTDKARRDIRLEPTLAALLRRHKLASAFSHDDDFVFSTESGAPYYYRNVASRGLDKGADRAGLNRDGVPRLSCHDLRHSYGSHLIRQGLDVVRVSRQLGHARPSITLDIYAHETEETQHSDGVSAALSGAFGDVL
jgi:integrase